MAYIFGSIWDRFNRNALNALSKSVEQQGVSIQDLVAKGQLTPTQYASLIQSVNGLISKGDVSFDDIDINKGKLLPKHLSEEVLKILTGNAPINAVPADGSITNRKLAEKSVDYENTTFFKSTRNLFEGTYHKYDLIGSGLARLEKNRADNGRTAFIKVRPSTQYTLQSFDSLSSGVLGKVRLVESAMNIDGLEFNGNQAILDNSIVSIVANAPYTFTTKTTTRFLYIQVAINGVEPRLQVEVGNKATEYIEQSWYIPLSAIEEFVIQEGGGTKPKNELEDMMWTWHTFPMAIYSETAKKTFVGGVRRGNTNGTSGHHIYSIDEETGKIVGNQLSQRFSGDDHNMVALADITWQNKVMAFYAGHSNTGIYYKNIDNYDVNNLSQELMIPESSGATYINVHHSRSTDTLYIFTRISGEGVRVFYTDDLGATWKNNLVFTDGYVDAGKSRRREGNLGLTLTGHGGTGYGDIYYCYMTLAGTIHNPDGTQIANVKTGENLPLNRNSLKHVIELPNSYSTVTSVTAYNHRLTFIESSTENNFEVFNYKYAIYNTSTNNFDIYDVATDIKGQLTDDTHAHYVGSCYDVGYRYPQIYLSLYNDTLEKWQIWEYSARIDRPTDGWSKVKMDESDLKLFRPIGVMLDNGARKPFPGLWLKGYYTQYEDYYANAQLPFNMDK